MEAAPENQDTYQGLRDIIARLRSPDGCPWDQEQTHITLRRNLLEECYEALEALDSGNSESLSEELGDVLQLQPHPCILHRVICGSGQCHPESRQNVSSPVRWLQIHEHGYLQRRHQYYSRLYCW